MKTRMWLIAVLPLAVLASGGSDARACTTFVIRGANVLVFGRNLDWYSGTGLLIANPRHLSKEGLPVAGSKAPQWVSRYGSVTFNQVGRELPFGGMNEAGLVVENMSLGTTTYPAADGRDALQACQWIQYQLDTCATVGEVIRSDSRVRIVDAVSRFHFLVCDKSGQTAVVEFLGGRMVSRSGNEMPVPVLANSSYEESLARYEHQADAAADRSIYNFATAAAMVKKASTDSSRAAVASAFSILSSVSQGVMTKWSIVYDVRNMEIHFKVFETPTIEGANKVFRKPVGTAVTKLIRVKDLDFDGRKTPKAVDLDADRAGDQRPYLVDCTPAVNLASITKAFAFYKGWGIAIEISPKDMADLSEYPNAFTCTDKK